MIVNRSVYIDDISKRCRRAWNSGSACPLRRHRPGRPKCKTVGILDAMSGTRTASAPPADRGGRGARERILAAATTLFSREGIHATGVERLTDYAHVSKRT